MAELSSGDSSGLALAVGALGDGRVNEAIQMLELAVALRPDGFDAHYHLGRAYLARGDHALAAASLRKALAAEPEHVGALCALGSALFRRQDYEPAREALETALRIDPGCQEARETLDQLPRREDRAALVLGFGLGQGPRAQATDPGFGPRRALIVMGGMSLIVSALLLVAFGQMRQSAGRQREAVGAEALLLQVSRAQAVYHAQHSTYGSLKELESAGMLENDVASGQPLLKYGQAVVSESRVGPEAFTVRASMPDGPSYTVDETGVVREEQ